MFSSLLSCFGSLYFSGKLPTYPSHKPTLTLTSHLGQNVGLGEGYVGSFPETYNHPAEQTLFFSRFSGDRRQAGSRREARDKRVWCFTSVSCLPSLVHKTLNIAPFLQAISELSLASISKRDLLRSVS